DDILSRLMAARYDGERELNQFEILNTAALLLFASLDTTKSAFGNMIAYLARHPESRRQLTTDPSVIPAAVEEFLRYESPVTTGRTVTRDVKVRGVQMRKGDRVLVLFASAGRDEKQFDRADEIDFGRPSNRHLAFGSGPHRCLGAHLARIELSVALEEIHRRMP